MRDIFGNEHVTDKMCLNVLKSIFDVLKEIIQANMLFQNPKTKKFSGFLYIESELWKETDSKR